MKKKTVLITGSTGMLGRALIGAMTGKYNLIGLDITADKRDAKTLDKFISCNITKEGDVKAAVIGARPDIVIHSAAWTDVDGCEKDEEKAHLVNTIGTENIAAACEEAGAVCLYISTDFVFDGNKGTPYREDDATAPLSVYGRTKFDGESAVRRILERHFIVRTSWLFGPYGRNFVDIILDKADKKQDLRIVMDQFGSPTYTRDLARGIITLIESGWGKDGVFGVYHITNTESCSWFKYAEEILKISGKRDVRMIPITSTELDRPAVRPIMSILSNSKFEALTKEGLRPWQLALRAYLKKG